MSAEWDVVVIGGGMAGYTAALRASELGARVALVEKGNLGGTCLNRGCIPAKAWLGTVGLLRKLRDARSMGLRVAACELDHAAAAERVRTVVAQLSAGMRNALEAAGVSLVRGQARLVRAGGRAPAVRVEGADRGVLNGRAVILATGSLPALPSVPGLEGAGVTTADASLDVGTATGMSWERVPDRLAIVGGGVIGVELATLYAGLGSHVTVCEIADHLVPGVDREIGEILRGALEREGVRVFTQVRLQRVTSGAGACRLEMETPGGEQVLEAERVLVATGRRPHLEGLGLEELGLRGRDGWVAVDDFMATSVPGVFAAGDITGKMMLAHVAARQGAVAAENALGQKTPMDYRAVPACMYTQPEVAWVGMSAQEARERGYRVLVGRASFGRNAFALASGEWEGWVEVVCEGRYGEILGVCIVGPSATELISEAAALIQAECTMWEWEKAIHPHPTLSETLGEAVSAALRSRA
ncbi:MAG: dihydrolipoyl dehydrogenase [Bacillota bacterium]|nr:dihydrolipoyl dehydrogenase [Bacillota bacterium]